MERHFDISLQELKAQLVQMAGQVERAIEIVTLALQQHHHASLPEVHAIEKNVNQAHKDIDEACIKLIALQQPMAADLRLIVAILKINNDLERMGDQAVNIAYNCEKYVQGPPVKPLIDLPVMADKVKLMVRDALDAFVKEEKDLAQNVLMRDDQVDELKEKIIHEVLEIIKSNPDQAEQSLSLIFIARNLERIGDHATNIAEDVIFAVSGEDIRHSAPVETKKDIYNPK